MTEEDKNNLINSFQAQLNLAYFKKILDFCDVHKFSYEHVALVVSCNAFTSIGFSAGNVLGKNEKQTKGVLQEMVSIAFDGASLAVKEAKH